MGITLKVIGALLLLATCGVIAVYAYLGGFRRITVDEDDEGPFVFLYRESSTHDSKAVGAITTELHERLVRLGAREGAKPFDIFEPANSGRPNQIGFVVPRGTNVELLRSGHVHVREIPRQTYMVVRFPFRTQLSFLVGYLKVDPALAAHRAKHSYAEAPAMARNDGAVITYLQPISR